MTSVRLLDLMIPTVERNKGSKSPCALAFPPGHVTGVTTKVKMGGLEQRFPHFVVTHLLDGFIDLLEKCFYV